MAPTLPPVVLGSRKAIRNQNFAIRISLVVGFLMLSGKWYAYLRTGSAAILSDAAESVVHVLAVGFAAYSLWLSFKPPDTSHPYGHDRISFFSAGVEGTLIMLAAAVIIVEAVSKWLAGLELQNLGEGALYVASAGAINAILGWYLVWQGKRHNSLVLVANGKHVLTDSWTSLGVVGGLLLVLWTGWLPFDPLFAIAVAMNILWSGGKLVRQSVGGLMDEGDPATDSVIRDVLNRETATRQLAYHEIRHRNAGNTIWIEFHLLFPRNVSIGQAHWQATEIEAALKAALPLPVNVITHLEPVEDHDQTHLRLKDSKE